MFRSLILDTIFPRRCLGCGVLVQDDSRKSYICKRCLGGIAITKSFACAFCKSPVVLGRTCHYCVKEHFLDRLLVAVSYEEPIVEKIIKTMKYRFVSTLADDVAELMVKHLKKVVAGGLELASGLLIVTPVPLHRKRLNWRGFNQAEILARRISADMGFDFCDDLLSRRRDNKPQADMPNRQSRVENARNIFALNSDRGDMIPVAGKTILLIDDISTTGSTLNDCARALKGAGAKEVIGFVFARNHRNTKTTETQKEMVSKLLS